MIGLAGCQSSRLISECADELDQPKKSFTEYSSFSIPVECFRSLNRKSSRYLSGLISKVERAYPEFLSSPDKVRISLHSSEKWISYRGLFGLCLPRDLILNLEYENELVALLMWHLLRVGENDESAFQGTVEGMYSSRYDPRGLSSIFGVLLNKRKNSPYSKEKLLYFRGAVDEVISKATPIRNPYVQSSEFLLFQREIRK